MMRTIRILLIVSAAILLVAFPSITLADDSRLKRQVFYSGDADFDACISNGRVRGLDPAGDNFLAVRAGPGSKFQEVARIHEGDWLAICEVTKGWFGIVFFPKGDEAKCGTSAPRERRSAYSGPCRAGWVSKKFVGDLAG